MGKIRTKVLGSEEESEQKQKDKVKREQKKLREGAVLHSGKGQSGKIADLAASAEEVKLKSPEEIEKEAAALLHPEELAQEEIKKPKEEKEKPKTQKVRSKKYQASLGNFDKTKKYSLNEAIELVKKLNYAKFDATFEAHLVMAEKDAKATLTFPHSTGKSIKVMAFVSPDKEKEAKEAGADYVADNETISKIEKGEVDFQAVVATPDWMPKLGKLAKILGPKGLMPNPKAGNITAEPGKVIKALKGGQVTVKCEAEAPLIHTVVGKVSHKSSDLEDNLKVLINALGTLKIVSMTLKSTMSPGVKVLFS